MTQLGSMGGSWPWMGSPSGGPGGGKQTAAPPEGERCILEGWTHTGLAPQSQNHCCCEQPAVSWPQGPLPPAVPPAALVYTPGSVPALGACTRERASEGAGVCGGRGRSSRLELSRGLSAERERLSSAPDPPEAKPRSRPAGHHGGHTTDPHTPPAGWYQSVFIE